MKAILVNADGTTETRESADFRIVDYDRGKVWSECGTATSDGVTLLKVYAEIPWNRFSQRTPKEEREAQEQYRRQKNV